MASRYLYVIPELLCEVLKEQISENFGHLKIIYVRYPQQQVLQ